MRSVAAIMSGKFDLIITQWTALNRIWFFPGPDTQYFTNDQKFPDYRYRDIYLSPKEKLKFNNTLLLMNHDFYNILHLIDYCTILDSLANLNKLPIVYINGLLPWQDDLMLTEITNLEKNLSLYTKEILDFENRNDDEVINFFNILNKKALKINQSHWVNLFDSWQKNNIDIGPEGHHPGVLSHQLMADKLINHIKDRKFLL
jgi:hypothetical protein